MSRGTVIVFAKDPIPGEVKTRLVPPLSVEQAAQLATASLTDLMRRLAALDVHLVLAWSGDAARAPRFLTPKWSLLAQGKGALGERLARTTNAVFAERRGPVAVTGSDHPDLPLARIEAALEAARRGAIGWITTRDGGYACLTLPQALPDLFTGIPWSTPDAAGATRTAAARLGFPMRDFGPWYDLDTVEDLGHFLAESANERECAATWAVLSRLGLSPGFSRPEAGSHG